MSTDNTTPDKPKAETLTVRFVNDLKSGQCWFEEKLTNGQWVVIPNTKYACEGNSRDALAREIERRRQQRLMIHRNIGPEEIIPIL